MNTQPDAGDSCTPVTKDELRRAVAAAKELAKQPFVFTAEERREITDAVLNALEER